mgnify:FL=1
MRKKDFISSIKFSPFLRSISIAGAVLLASISANAAILVDINSLGYVGSWEKFDTEADARNATNQVDSGTIPQRDLQIFIRDGQTSPDVFQLITGWNLGSGNPSNTNNGFVQISDIGSTTVDSLDAGWTDSNFDTYDVNIIGTNALRRTSSTVGNQEARLGVGPGDRSTNGNWLDYDLSLTFNTLNSNEMTTGIQTAIDEPGSVTGNLSIIFENPNKFDLDGNPNANKGFYRAEISINQTSWSVDNNITKVVDDTSTFEAPSSPIPEPNTAILCILGFFSITTLRRRSSCKK